MNLLKEDETRKLLRIGARTLRRWRSKGLIPFYRLPNGQVRYSSESISTWLKRGCPQPRSAESEIK